MVECSSAKICGLVDRHPSEQKTLQDLGKRKQKVEGELAALKSELQVKKSISEGVLQSFESKLHDILIRTNPEKYLTINRRPKEDVILADSYIIKKYYGSQNVDKETMERDSEMYQTIIKSTEERFNVQREKNSIIVELQRRGIKWPMTAASSLPSVATQPLPSTVQFPWLQSTSVYQQNSNSAAAMNTLAGLGDVFGGYVRSIPSDASNHSSNKRKAVASPPLPPPLPDDDDQYGYINSTDDINN